MSAPSNGVKTIRPFQFIATIYWLVIAMFSFITAPILSWLFRLRYPKEEKHPIHRTDLYDQGLAQYIYEASPKVSS